MPEGTPAPQQLQLNDSIVGAEYTNWMQVFHSKEEFSLVFANVFPPSGKIVGKIITSPGHFKRMVAAMVDNLKKYEDANGTIEAAPEMNKEIGFKSA